VRELRNVSDLFERTESVLQRLALDDIENLVLASVDDTGKSEHDRGTASNRHRGPFPLRTPRSLHDLVNHSVLTLILDRAHQGVGYARHMQFAITFVASFVIAIGIVVFGWRRRPVAKATQQSGFGRATLGLGVAAVVLLLPSITAPLSIVLAGMGLITGAFALIRHDSHRWTIVGQCIVALPALFWVVFLVAEIAFPH